MLNKQLQVLYEAYKLFNEHKFNNELPQDIAITIQSKGKTKSYGWCTVDPIWYTNDDEIQFYYEINFSAEYMNRSYIAIMETLLHEMCHLHNIIRGINDCSRKQNHNENFKAEAEKVGMIVEKVKQYGWATTKFTDELINIVNGWNIDKTVFNIARAEKEGKKVIRNNKKIKMICPNCGKKVSTDEEFIIICGECGSEFVKK